MPRPRYRAMPGPTTFPAMNRFAFYLVRLLRVALGFIAGLVVAAAMVVILDLNKGRLPEPLAGAATVGFYAFLAARLFWPLLLVLLVAEVRRWRSPVFHLGLGLVAALAALTWTYLRAPAEAPDPILGEEPVLTVTRVAVTLAAGLAGALVSWFIAGRSAGLQPPERTRP
jgi:MFS family permease